MLKTKFDLQQYCAPLISYKFWDSDEQKMYRVSSLQMGDNDIISQLTVSDNKQRGIIKSATSGHVIPSTGLYCMKSEELYFGDLVSCKFLGNSKPRLVFWDNGWRVMGTTPKEFEQNIDSVYRIGNRWENEDIYAGYIRLIGKYTTQNYERNPKTA